MYVVSKCLRKTVRGDSATVTAGRNMTQTCKAWIFIYIRSRRQI